MEPNATPQDLSKTPEPPQYQTPEAWIISGPLPERSVWDRIEAHHVRPLCTLFHVTGVPLVPSGRSCYRPRSYELQRGRSGSSLHTFPGSSRGACDLVRADGVGVSSALDLLIVRGPWRRICHYPRNGFVHVDYGDANGVICERRQLFTCAGGSAPWRFVRWLPEC
jgi:hypothetical protein